ncbi:glycosyltransferase [Eisenibacter elegans]|jgi:glycosyltransferase involved in cell wall biosynthesis|uniref:glycosyltransferase n=1 Tax=Eisenibacter elegans TaxID=997 RepID=UPI0004235C60|nr:glycosyltransferase [Eisenibacter elegans]
MSHTTPTVIYLSYDGLTDPLGQSQILPYLQGLAAAGYRFCVISAEKPEAYRLRSDNIRAQLGAHIEWYPVFYHKSPPVLSTLWDLNRMWRQLRRLIHQKQTALIHCRSYPVSLLGLRAKRRFGLPFIFDMRGFWADERVEGGLWPLKSPVFRRIYRYFKAKEQQYLQESAHTISLTHNAAEEIRRWQLPRLSPITVIPCCVDTTLFCPAVGVSTAKPYALAYLGSLGTWYMLPEMLDFFVCLRQSYPQARFLFITRDAPSLVYQAAEARQIPAEALTVVAAERHEVPHYLAQAQASVFFIRPTFSKKASSATKLGELLAMGIPVIGNADIGDQGLILPQAGAMVQAFNQAEYRRVVAQWPQLMALQPEELRTLGLRYFSLQEGISRYEAVYAAALKNLRQGK